MLKGMLGNDSGSRRQCYITKYLITLHTIDGYRRNNVTHGRSHKSRIQRNSLKASIWVWFIVDRHNEVHANAFGLSEIRG